MVIFDDHSRPILLDSIHSPVLTGHFWVLDLAENDFMLTTLDVMEEMTCPSVKLRVENFEFIVPANWSVLVYDVETSMLDSVQLAEAAGRDYQAFVYGPTKNSAESSLIEVIDYYVEHQNVSPSLNKHQMLCHSIGPDTWINIGPSDPYRRFVCNIMVGDILHP